MSVHSRRVISLNKNGEPRLRVGALTLTSPGRAEAPAVSSCKSCSTDRPPEASNADPRDDEPRREAVDPHGVVEVRVPDAHAKRAQHRAAEPNAPPLRA